MDIRLLPATTVLGRSVVNLDGHELGHVKDLMLDVSKGNIAYAVLARGGLLGVGERVYAVPWSLLFVEGQAERLVLDVAEETLDSGPGFDPDSWPTETPEWSGERPAEQERSADAESLHQG